MLVFYLLNGPTDPRADGNNARGPWGGGNVFQNLQMSVVFPPPCRAISYGGATVRELNE